MKKALLSMVLAATMAATPIAVSAAETEAFNPEGLIDWFNESYLWMSVEGGHWSEDPADKPTPEELEKMFSMAMKQQTGTAKTEYFFIAIEDVEEQRSIIGDQAIPYNDGEPVPFPKEIMCTEGTVTVLVMADNILTEEEGHVSEYEGFYFPSISARYDVGMACGLLEVAAASMGYHTHYVGATYGENAPHDLANNYQSMSRYVKPEYTRIRSWRNRLGDEPREDSIFPVAGNCIFVCAIIIGKPAAGEDVETYGSYHGRPDNWVIWDGVPNEEPSPSIALGAERAAAAAAAAVSGGVIELGENEYLGVATGKNGEVKVKVTVEDGKITAVEVVEHQETAGISATALKEVPEMILEAQSAEVDNVAGATETADAIKAAVKSALAQAGF